MPRELLSIIVYLWKTKTKLTSDFVQFDGAEWDVHGVGEERVLAVDFDSVEVLPDAGIPGVWSLMLVPLHHLCERTNQIQRQRIWLTYWYDSILIILLLFVQSVLQNQSNTQMKQKVICSLISVLHNYEFFMKSDKFMGATVYIKYKITDFDYYPLTYH